MKKKITLGALIALIVMLYLSQNLIIDKFFSVSIQLLKPNDSFNETNMSPKPDYSKNEYWATLPTRNDESDIVPEGITANKNNGNAPVDVFYIHGTGFTSGNSWTSPIDNQSATAENTRFSLANEASIFNGCCNIYAPRYREASLFTYISVGGEERDRILTAVYPDIVSAFEYYLKNFNNNRPFIIVSHSQGTHHAMKLVKEVIDPSPLANKLVAAYLIGGIMKPVSHRYIESLKAISACENAQETGCIIHWDTYGIGGSQRLFQSKETPLCTTPLTWTTNEKLASRDLHLGSAPISGSYSMKFYGADKAPKIHFNPPTAITTEFTHAQCKEGMLYVADLANTEYAKLGSMSDKSYHGIDLPLFHLNIRQNVQLRIENYFSDLTVKEENTP